MSTPPDYHTQVEEIAEVIEDIGNSWECDFIADMLDWTGDFTDKQKDVIDRLYKRACESPY